MAGRRWELLLLLSYTHSLYNQAHRGWGKWRVTELLNMTNFFREARKFLFQGPWVVAGSTLRTTYYMPKLFPSTSPLAC
ncbi:hypothetical protein EV401DRAFT_1977505 [Pisolithus croceorrhizus]|nr:hypothetical protein EV401DRAFT_1977505 [Pisolithus croceorrhizus]